MKESNLGIFGEKNEDLIDRQGFQISFFYNIYVHISKILQHNKLHTYILLEIANKLSILLFKKCALIYSNKPLFY